MLEIVGYFVRLGLSIAVALLNLGAVLYIVGSARRVERAGSIARDACYGAVLLAAISIAVLFV